MTCDLCLHTLVGCPNGLRQFILTLPLEDGREACLPCIVREPGRFPKELREQALTLLEEQLQYLAKCGYEDTLNHLLSAAALQPRHDLQTICLRAQAIKPGLPEWCPEGQIVGYEGDDQRYIVIVSYWDHPFISIRTESRQILAVDEQNEYRKIAEMRPDSDKYGYTAWFVEEENTLGDVYVGQLPKLIAAMCKVGLAYPNHLPFSEPRKSEGIAQRAKDNLLSQEELDAIRDFFKLVGAIPQDAEESPLD
jgi:hypothetical protein